MKKLVILTVSIQKNNNFDKKQNILTFKLQKVEPFDSFNLENKKF